MHRILTALAVLMVLTAREVIGQACFGSVAQEGQVGIAALWDRSGSMNAYGVDVRANLLGRTTTAFGYTYAGDAPGVNDLSVHTIEGAAAYEALTGPFSVCPALGMVYQDGGMAVSYTDPDTQAPATIESSWRMIELPATLDIGFRYAAASDVVIVPSAQVGGMYWRFDGRDRAMTIIDGRPQAAGSEFVWLAGAGLTLGWNRLYVAGSVINDARERSARKWSLSVGWLVR